jgi:hypothetical protein
MQVSAELRWFWKVSLPPGVEAWFHGRPIPPGGGVSRRDEYLLDAAQRELGIKRRGGGEGLEIKGLVARGRQVPAPFTGQVQVWSKWISTPLTLDPFSRVALDKTRWLRKFDTTSDTISEIALGADELPVAASARLPEQGCHLELVVIELAGHPRWHSVGFEAFGDLTTIERSLHRTLDLLASSAPSLGDGRCLSYPEWLPDAVAP